MPDKPYGVFGPQPPQPGEEPDNSVDIGIGVGAAAASGFIPYRKGRIFDHYVSGIRSIETAFPSAILRTFRVSESLSPLESYNKIHVSKDTLAQGNKYSEYLKRLFGPSVQDVTLSRTGASFGTITDSGERAIGEGLQILAGTQKGQTIADYYARLQGVDIRLEGVAGQSVTDSLNDALLHAEYQRIKPDVSYSQWVESLSPAQRQKRIILAAPYRSSIDVGGINVKIPASMRSKFAKAEVATNLTRAMSATAAGRLNTLLRAPLELPVVGPAVSKVPFLKSLAVKPGTTTQMLGGYIGRGLLIGAAFKGLEYVDYLRAEGTAFEGAAATTIAGTGLGAFLGKSFGQRFSPRGALIGGAIGLLAGISSRFDEGIFAGAASYYTDFQIRRAQASEAIGLSESLRAQEEISPGLTSLSSVVGFGGVGALGAGLLSYGSFISGIKPSKDQPLWSAIQSRREELTESFLDKTWSSKAGKKFASTKIGSAVSKIKSPMALGFLGGVAAWGAVNATVGLLSGNIMAAIPGAGIVGTTDTAEDLKAIYSGEKEVAIRKGRWWEFGRSSAYGGGKIDYFREHNIARLRKRAFQKGLYGDEAEKWEYDPMLNPFKAIFGSDEWKYHYERKYQYERPAPLTSTYGEDIPFIGPLVAATIGKVLKPRKLVRPDEWQLEGGGFAEEQDLRPEEIPAYELGGIGPGAPVAPESSSQVFNRLNYMRREAIGLVGFAEGAIQKATTGREEIFRNLQTMETMGKETGSEYWLWKHLNIGGAAGTSEAIRRFIPRTPSYLETYNPLKNTMPSWMPDDYFIEFQHGNPFQKVAEAEIRLPGEGYAALNPEVQGLDAEEYPLIHRLKILSDVAMWSDEYKYTLAKAKRANLRDADRERLAVIEDQVRQKKESRRQFHEYRFQEDMLESQTVTVSDVIRPGVITTEEFGDLQVSLQGIGAIKDSEKALEFTREALLGQEIQLQTAAVEGRRYTQSGNLKAVAMLDGQDLGSILAEQGLAEDKALQSEFEQLRFSANERFAGQLAETIMHGIDTPLEMLTPMSPASKFIRQRSAIEEYEKTQAIGTGNAFWDRPVENFLQPTVSSLGYELGLTGIPENVQRRREISEYFDMLQWTKQEKIRREALAQGEYQTAKEAQEAKEETVFGADVFGMPPLKAIPRMDRNFFNAFVEAKTEEDREKILSLVPENQRRIYISQWMRQEERAAIAKKNAKIETELDNRILATTKSMRRSEGFDYDEKLERQWLAETNGEIPYDEWIRAKKAEEYFSTHSLPGADWLGWCLPGYQEININKDSKKIEEINIGDSVKTLDSYKKVLNIFKRDVNEELVELKVHHNMMSSMCATNNHKILVIKGMECKYNYNKKITLCTDRQDTFKKCIKCKKPYIDYEFEWVDIDKAKTDMFLPVSLLESSKEDLVIDLKEIFIGISNTVITDDKISNKRGPKSEIPRFITIDEELSWLIGYYYAEGHILRSQNRDRGIGFTANLNEIDFIKKAKSIIKNKFNLDSKVFERYREEGNNLNLSVNNRLLSIFFNKSFGRFCDKKHRPLWLEEITKESQMSILNGLLDGDGSKDGRKVLSITNKDLANMAKQIFESNGRPVSIRQIERKDRKTQWSIRPVSKVNCFIGQNFIAYRIKEVNKIEYSGTVYDIEVEDLHMYSCDIGIYHNSPSVDLDDVKMQYVNMEGLDYHDFDLWGDRERALAQKPYINEELIRQMKGQEEYSRVISARSKLQNIANLSKGSHVQFSMVPGMIEDDYALEVRDGRQGMIDAAYKLLGA